MTAFDAEDEYMIVEGVRVNRKTFAIDGIRRDNAMIDLKDMSDEEKMRAHAVVRKHTFDWTGEENKGA